MLENPSTFEVVLSKDLSNHHNSSVVTTLIDTLTQKMAPRTIGLASELALHDSNNVITAYSTFVEDSCDPLRDVVYLLDYYFPKPPLSMNFMSDLQPKPRVPADPKEPRFYPNPIGKNTLHSLLRGSRH